MRMVDFEERAGLRHDECGYLLDQLDQQVQREEWVLAEASLERFCRASREHFDAEEQTLFPAFERTHLADIGSTSLMRVEHRQMLGLMECMSGTLAVHEVPAYLELSLQLRRLLLQHARKEEFLIEVVRDEAAPAAGYVAISPEM